jgi:hypothetical protein
MITTVSEQQKVYHAAKKLGGYRELIAFAAKRKKEKEDGIES